MIFKIYWIVLIIVTALGIDLQFKALIKGCKEQGISPIPSMLLVGIVILFPVPLYYAAYKYIFGI